MVDKEWTKILAQASFQKNTWTFDEDVRQLRENRASMALEELLREAEDYGEVFNQHSKRKMTVLPLFSNQDRTQLIGILFLVGRVSIQLKFDGVILKKELHQTIGFQTTKRDIEIYQLNVDIFGSMQWLSQSKRSLNHETMVKDIIVELVKEKQE